LIAVQHILPYVLFGRAEVLQRLNRHSEAVADWDMALKLDDGRMSMAIRERRGYSLARDGQHVRAFADANELFGMRQPGPATTYDCACICAICITKVGDNKSLAEKYAVRAVELLRQAVAKGFSNFLHLVNDGDLAPLRGRDDFTALLWEIAEATSGKSKP